MFPAWRQNALIVSSSVGQRVVTEVLGEGPEQSTHVRGSNREWLQAFVSRGLALPLGQFKAIG